MIIDILTKWLIFDAAFLGMSLFCTLINDLYCEFENPPPNYTGNYAKCLRSTFLWVAFPITTLVMSLVGRITK